jgi:hypothetical protein
MQICMKLNEQSRKNLQRRIAARLSLMAISVTEVARRAEVDAGQASRICRGEFRTLSYNVMQICNTLEIDLIGSSKGSAMDERLTAQLLALWDGSHEDAERLSRFLTELAKLRWGSAGTRRRSKQRRAPARKQPQRTKRASTKTEKPG